MKKEMDCQLIDKWSYNTMNCVEMLPIDISKKELRMEYK